MSFIIFFFHKIVYILYLFYLWIFSFIIIVFLVFWYLLFLLFLYLRRFFKIIWLRIFLIIITIIIKALILFTATSPKFSSASITKLISTSTGHMVTSMVFGNPEIATWAFFKFCLLHKINKLFILRR